MRIWLIRAALFALMLAPTAWFLLTNPLAVPLLKTGAAGVTARIESQMDRAISDGTLERRLAEAVAAVDAPTTDRLYRLAETRGVTLPEPLDAAARALTGLDDSLSEQAWACARCAADVTSCRSLEQIASCALPFELSPLGDLNALRQQATNWATRGEVDQLEVGLALVGVGATVVVVFTGGSSATIKAGTAGARVARRLGALTAGFSYTLRVAADIPVNWSRVDDLMMRRVPLDAVTDTAKLATVGGYARDIGRIREATSPTDTLVLMRHVETGEDLSRLARVSEAAGTHTADAFALLGKSRVFRALDEVGAVQRWGAALLGTLAVQGLFVALRAGLRRAARRARRA